MKYKVAIYSSFFASFNIKLIKNNGHLNVENNFAFDYAHIHHTLIQSNVSNVIKVASFYFISDVYLTVIILKVWHSLLSNNLTNLIC